MLSRLDNRCAMGHTALFPGKNDARAEWVHQVDRDDDIITVSHGALDVLNVIRHRGRILVCDTDSGVTTAAHYIRVGDPKNGKPSDYPGLRFLPEAHCDVREAVPNYLGAVGDAKRLGAVDLDMTGTLEQVWPIASDVIQSIKSHSHSRGTLVLLTYRNGRDNQGRNATGKRVQLLSSMLPWYARVAWYKGYRSDWIGRFATREKGSSMTLAAIKIR
jgi:hypothetical protein